MTDHLFGLRKSPHPEHPAKLQKFREQLQALQWNAGSEKTSLNAAFWAFDELAFAEVEYYFRSRRRSARRSGIFRSVGWFFGTLGFVLPLLAGTQYFGQVMLSPWGYVSLAIAGSVLAANELFGGTKGHVRYTSTQLALESVMASQRIRWGEFMADTEVPTKQGFEIIQSYVAAVSAAMSSETADWGKTVLADFAKFAATVKPGSRNRTTG